MREVLFKAISKESGDWVEGDLVHFLAGTCIRVESINIHAPVAKVSYKDIEVYPATVCQSTGLTDSKGVKIFEWDETTDKDREPYAVIFKDGEFILQHEDGVYSIFPIRDALSVTGNIHDNYKGESNEH